ncbi:hypothetical protein ACTJK4_23115 [Ralstonia sp. 22111]|uniref:hypothetical protein n=1 Tax=Ralstonia TaxID=48736 RepID=UPI003D95DC2C
MQPDLRGFEYAVEPLRQQRRWHVERVLAELGRLQHDISQAQEVVRRFCIEYEGHARAIAETIHQRFDIDTHRRGLYWLAALRSQILESESRLDMLQQKKVEMQQAFVLAQQKLDVMERHRDESIADYAQAQNGRLLAQADQDWMARQGRREEGGGV